MTAPSETRITSLSAEVRSDVAYRRARGAAWEKIGEQLKFDPDALRRAADADLLYAAQLDKERAEVVDEAEAEALQRLRKLTQSPDDKVGLRAAVVIVRYVTECRRAERRKPPSPRTPPAEPRGGVPNARNEKGASGQPCVTPTRVVPMG